MLPEGFQLVPDFLSEAEEAAILGWARTLPSEPFVMRGQASKRRITRFGVSYGVGEGPPLPIPAELDPIRRRVATFVGLEPEDFAQAMISRYPPGAGIGWHRDFPVFGDVIAGISLGSEARMRLRPKDRPRDAVDVVLPARSLYVLSGPARSEWEHHLPAVKAERWSITLRTLRKKR
jgi:alkylated DNA repair protein (DNA oxidative demethylase)